MKSIPYQAYSHIICMYKVLKSFLFCVFDKNIFLNKKLQYANSMDSRWTVQTKWINKVEKINLFLNGEMISIFCCIFVLKFWKTILANMYICILVFFYITSVERLTITYTYHNVKSCKDQILMQKTPYIKT